MKIHNENCEGCVSTEGDKECFDDISEMMNYHKSQRSWDEVIWDGIYYPCWRVFDKIRYFPKEVKWFIQRGKRGWSDCDSWNVYSHIAEILPSMLKKMKEDNHGYPSAMYDDNEWEHTDAEDKAAKEKWGKILNGIIKTFEIEAGIGDSVILDLGPRPTKRQREFGKEHCEKFGVKLLTKEDRKIRKEGWKNFQKYFHNLWD